MKKTITALAFMALIMGNAQDNLTQESIKGMLVYNQGQVIQLAEAFDEGQYDWRPSEGVNSVREALLHVAGANYFLATKLGFAPPADVD
ncbi:MAG: DinB family protein, partial [Bacteroidota bacterium]